MPRRSYHNAEPGPVGSGAPRDAIKVEFARRLQRARVEKGWNQSDLARHAAPHTANGKFGRDNVSNYERGVSLPGPAHLAALAKALDCKPADLLPQDSMPSVDERLPSFEMRATGEGTAWLRINQAVPWSVAVQIAALLKKDGGTAG